MFCELIDQWRTKVGGAEGIKIPLFRKVLIFRNKNLEIFLQKSFKPRATLSPGPH